MGRSKTRSGSERWAQLVRGPVALLACVLLGLLLGWVLFGGDEARSGGNAMVSIRQAASQSSMLLSSVNFGGGARRDSPSGAAVSDNYGTTLDRVLSLSGASGEHHLRNVCLLLLQMPAAKLRHSC